MTDSTMDKDALVEKAKKMASEGKTISKISEELGITWNEARSYTISWQGAKVRITNRLKHLASEADQSKREELATEVDGYVDFLYDAAKHLSYQADRARKALDR